MKVSGGEMDIECWEREAGMGNPDLEVTSKSVVHEAVRVSEVGLGKQEGHEEKKAKDL